MSDYALATVCVNGHPLSGDDRISDNFCSVCGALTISDCPNCNRPIRGKVVKKEFLTFVNIYHRFTVITAVTRFRGLYRLFRQPLS